MSKGLTYSDAGVDIDRSNITKKKIKMAVHSTYNKAVLTELGAFGGLYSLSGIKLKNPVLVSSVDGVGTKLKLAFITGNHRNVGCDIVSHCVNDILVHGATPLFFMDYIAMGKHNRIVIMTVINSIARACRENNCVLLGGEMAEMPDFYKKGEYDLAGMIVGVVDRKDVIDGSEVGPGDIVLGLASGGLHTNGFSLARKVLFEKGGFSVDDSPTELKGGILGEVLLKPHKSYLRPIKAVLKSEKIHGLAHITGGGFKDNIVRILPKECRVVLDSKSWIVPPIFSIIQRSGNIPEMEMFRTFNMGIGMVAIVSKKRYKNIMNICKSYNQMVFKIGFVEKGKPEVEIL